MQKWFLGLILIAAIIMVIAWFTQGHDEAEVVAMADTPVVSDNEDVSSDYSSPPPAHRKSAYDALNTAEGLTIETPVSVYPTGISDIEVIIKNTSSHTYTLGESFYIERNYNGQWYQAEDTVNNDIAFNDIGYDVGPDEEKTLTHRLWMFDHLPAGSYRIIKDALYVREPGDYDKHFLSTEFKVTD